MKDLTLNNGTTAEYKYTDHMDRPVYELGNGRLACCTNLDGTNLYYFCKAGEPRCKAVEEWQPIIEPKYFMVTVRSETNGFIQHARHLIAAQTKRQAERQALWDQSFTPDDNDYSGDHVEDAYGHFSLTVLSIIEVTYDQYFAVKEVW